MFRRTQGGFVAAVKKDHVCILLRIGNREKLDELSRHRYSFLVTIGVYGMGRFGSFWALSLARAFPQDTVLGYSRSSPVPEGIVKATLEEVCRAQTLFLCCAISSMEEVLTQIEPLLSADTLVADTCSVKVHPAQLMQKTLGEVRPMLATHPMFGPDSGRQGVAGLPIVVHPLGENHPRQREWRSRFEAMGLKVLEMSPEDHDRIAAFSQGVTHLIGRVLRAMDLQPHPMATTGFKNLLEMMNQTCNDPWQLFLDLQRYNPYTPQMREKFLNALQDILKSIEEES